MAEVFSGEDMARQSFLTLWQSYCEKKIEIEQLRGELSLAEEGLANYAQEVEQLKAERDQWKKRADELFFSESSGHPTGNGV